MRFIRTTSRTCTFMAAALLLSLSFGVAGTMPMHTDIAAAEHGNSQCTEQGCTTNGPVDCATHCISQKAAGSHAIAAPTNRIPASDALLATAVHGQDEPRVTASRTRTLAYGPAPPAVALRTVIKRE